MSCSRSNRWYVRAMELKLQGSAAILIILSFGEVQWCWLLLPFEVSHPLSGKKEGHFGKHWKKQLGGHEGWLFLKLVL